MRTVHHVLLDKIKCQARVGSEKRWEIGERNLEKIGEASKCSSRLKKIGESNLWSFFSIKKKTKSWKRKKNCAKSDCSKTSWNVGFFHQQILFIVSKYYLSSANIIYRQQILFSVSKISSASANIIYRQQRMDRSSAPNWVCHRTRKQSSGLKVPDAAVGAIPATRMCLLAVGRFSAKGARCKWRGDEKSVNFIIRMHTSAGHLRTPLFPRCWHCVSD